MFICVRLESASLVVGGKYFHTAVTDSLKKIQAYKTSGHDDPVCKTGKKTQMCITDFWTQRERERVG